MTIIICIEDVVFQTELMVSQCSDMVRFNEPLLVIALWDQLLNLLVVVFCRQIYLIACCDVVVQ